MRTPLVAAAVLALLAAPAAAGHKKPVTRTYQVTAPVPYAVDGSSHCVDGVEGLSKRTETLRLPDRGVLVAELSGFVGDWVVEMFDDKGRMVAQGAAFDPTDTAPVRKATYRKGTPGQTLRLVACNVTGGPTATVRYTFTYR